MFCCFKQKTAYELRISDGSSDVCSSDLVKADLTYAWSVRTIWGIDGAGARQQAVSGDNVFANLGVVTPVGKIAAFAYLVDQDEAAMQSFRMSSQSYDARIDGTQPLGKAHIHYQQTDRTPGRERLCYYAYISVVAVSIKKTQ